MTILKLNPNDLTQLQQIRHKKGGKRAKIRQVKVVTH